MGEVFDERLTAGASATLTASRWPLAKFHSMKAEIISETPLNDGTPDKEDFEDTPATPA